MRAAPPLLCPRAFSEALPPGSESCCMAAEFSPAGQRECYSCIVFKFAVMKMVMLMAMVIVVMTTTVMGIIKKYYY